MKTKCFLFALAVALFSNGIFAQDRTTVTATSYDISDNLDLRAVASIFGESSDLEDFERRLNDPKTQISNLDLNGDRQVDYLRVIETIDNGVHLIVIQSVLDKDVFQDVATVEVEKQQNAVQVQVVGNVYMYGPNYVYEPVYEARPLIYDYFWATGYRPYFSSWYWGYYPSYYSFWAPYPVFTYHHHIHSHINVHNHYVYVNNPRNVRSYALTGNYRGSGYEVRNPGRSFNQRNNVRNSYELQQVRREDSRATSPRTTANTRSAATPGNAGNRTQNQGTRSNTETRATNQNTRQSVRTNAQSRATSTVTTPRTSSPQINTRSQSTSSNTATRAATPAPRANTRNEAPRVNSQSASPRIESPRTNSRNESPRMSSPSPASRSQGGAARSESRTGGRR